MDNKSIIDTNNNSQCAISKKKTTENKQLYN